MFFPPVFSRQNESEIDETKEDDHYEEKDWAPLPLGTVRLDAGTTELTVRALSRPGGEVMELRAVRIAPSEGPTP